MPQGHRGWTRPPLLRAQGILRCRRQVENRADTPDQAERPWFLRREEKALHRVAETELRALARHHVALPNDGQDSAGDHQPILRDLDWKQIGSASCRERV